MKWVFAVVDSADPVNAKAGAVSESVTESIFTSAATVVGAARVPMSTYIPGCNQPFWIASLLFSTVFVAVTDVLRLIVFADDVVPVVASFESPVPYSWR